jgi:hypothetical protein
VKELIAPLRVAAHRDRNRQMSKYQNASEFVLVIQCQ